MMCVYVGIFFDIPAAGGVLCASLASLGVPCGRIQGGGAGRRPSAGGLQPAIESLIYYGTGEVVSAPGGGPFFRRMRDGQWQVVEAFVFRPLLLIIDASSH